MTHVESVSSIKVLRLTPAGAIDSSFAQTTTAPEVMTELSSLQWHERGTTLHLETATL